jgi:hypothetical protein
METTHGWVFSSYVTYTYMTNSVVKQQKPRVGPVVTKKSAKILAELVMKVLDDQHFRGGRAIEYRDPFSDGLVRIHRDSAGRVYFRVPRVEASIRLNPSRVKLLLSRNMTALEDFLESHPLILQSLDESKLRAAMIK